MKEKKTFKDLEKLKELMESKKDCDTKDKILKEIEEHKKQTVLK